MKTFVVTVRLTVDEDTHENLQDIEAVAAEVRSWLEGLNAEVEQVKVLEVQS